MAQQTAPARRPHHPLHVARLDRRAHSMAPSRHPCPSSRSAAVCLEARRRHLLHRTTAAETDPILSLQLLVSRHARFRARGGRCLRSKETTVSQTPSASPTPSAIRWRGSRGAEAAPSVRLSSPSLTLSASVCPQVSCKHAACQRNNLYMSEEFRRRRCGPLFDEWKRCFDAEVCESCVLARIA